MARYTGPKDKLSRREGVNLFDKTKNPLSKRNYPPGIHGPKSKFGRMTSYGQQLREKQKAKRIYGLLERQFSNYYEKAFRKHGDTGQIMLQLLETRLDNVIYRSGLTDTRAQARQMVSHGFFLVNSKKVNIPSFQCKVGDVITVKDSKQDKKIIKEQLQKFSNKKELPEWLLVELKPFQIKISTLPQIKEEALLFDIKSIIEFYSR